MEEKSGKSVAAEKVEGYQAFYQDASNHNQFQIIPILHKESYVQTFENKIPTEKEYTDWKKNNNVKILEQGDVIGSKTQREGYKFTPKCGKEIYDYLNTRPMVEVESMVFQMFENPKDTDPYITKEGIQTLTKYLQEKCPRLEAKRLIELLANDGLEKYILKPIDKPENGNIEEKEKPENKDTN